MKVIVLGTEYRLEERDEQSDPKLKDMDGYCDSSIKLCVVDSLSTSDKDSKEDLSTYKQQIKRHELIHAFLSESGLDTCSGWARNEEMVDWIAIQFPKLLKAFEAADCI